ncbi:MAG: hypothetical protein IIB46_03310 [Nitrospinae bacterium]|nr:hypothetical protein [Nitrospinota bacterium]
MAGLVKDSLDVDGTVHAMVNSGARGSWGQTLQMTGIKGTVAGPTGRAVELPIKSSFKEGFNALEYFLSTHGTRKGMADTALRTATAGYLTRRLVNVAQDVVVHEEDCQDTEGGIMTLSDSEEVGTTLGRRAQGRILSEGLKHPKTGKVVLKRGTMIDEDIAQQIDELKVEEIVIPPKKSVPHAVALAPDGTLWFTQLFANKISKLEFSENSPPQIVEYLVPGKRKGPHDLAVDAKRNSIWFTLNRADSIGRLDLSRAKPGTDQGMEEFKIPTAGSHPNSLTLDSEGNVWFTEMGHYFMGKYHSKIGKLIP